MASNLRVDSIVPSSSGNVSIGTATGGVTIPGDLGIAGVLTYEDVTNVDSVGVITARSGVNVSGGEVKVGTAVTVSSGGVITSGIVTATNVSAASSVTAATFHGSGANLTNLSVSSNYKITTGSVITPSGSATSQTITGIPSDAVKVELLFYNIKGANTGIFAMRAGNASNIDNQTWFSAHSYVVNTNNTNGDIKTSQWSSRFQMPHEDYTSSNNRRTGIFIFNKHIDNIWYCVNDMVYSENGTNTIARNFINKGYIDMGASGFDRIKIFTYSNEVNIESSGRLQLKYYQVV